MFHARARINRSMTWGFITLGISLAIVGGDAARATASASENAFEVLSSGSPLTSCANDGSATTVQPGLKELAGASELDKTTPANLVYNGEFDLNRTANQTTFWSPHGNATDSGNAIGTTGTMGTIDGWTASGGGTKSYGMWSNVFRYWFMRDSAVDPSPNPFVYFGNEKVQMDGVDGTANTYFGTGVNTSIVAPPLTAYNQSSEYGDIASPLAISQNVTLVPGTTYRLQFLQGSEGGSGSPTLDGLAGLGITGYDLTYFRVHNPTHSYIFEFTATAATTTITFANWGHLRKGSDNSRFSNELSLDDVRINECVSSLADTGRTNAPYVGAVSAILMVAAGSILLAASRLRR